MSTKSDSLPDRSRGPISKNAAYQKAASHFDLALDTIIDIMKTSHHDSTRLGAANKIIDKVLPDLKSTDLTAEEGIKFLFEIVQDNRLRDANTKDTTPNKELPSAGEDILIGETVQDSSEG